MKKIDWSKLSPKDRNIMSMFYKEERQKYIKDLVKAGVLYKRADGTYSYHGDKLAGLKMKRPEDHLVKGRKYLAEIYEASLNDVMAPLLDIYNHCYDENGKPDLTKMYTYKRYYEQIDNLNWALADIDSTVCKFLDKYLDDAYVTACKYCAMDCLVGKGVFWDEEKALWLVGQHEIKSRSWVEQAWAKDGKKTKERTSIIRTKTEKTIRQGLVECVANGRSVDDFKRLVERRLEVGENLSWRIARTELMHAYNSADYETYRRLGIDKYKYIATMDDRVCPECKALHNRVFPLEMRVEGINYPVLEVNCRCTTVGVFLSDELQDEIDRKIKEIKDAQAE